MFSSSTYTERRKTLKEKLGSGLVFLPGNKFSPINYLDNMYQFRQDSTFLYYFGLDSEELNAVIDIDNDKEIIFGDDVSLEDIVWMGPQEKLADRAELVGVTETLASAKLKDYLDEAKSKGQKIHWLPQYRGETFLQFVDLFDIHHSKINEMVSEGLIKAVVAQREIKSLEEVEEIEKALELSYEMNIAAMKLSKHGLYEREVWGAVAGIAHRWGGFASFPIIFSVRGETLHNHHHDNVMKDGDMLILDSGAESPLHYASDITRSFPVSGKFNEKQKVVYNTVLKAELEAINMMKPGLSYRECHLHAGGVIFEGLKELGITKGNTEDAVKNGAHALFMPHGLGHHMGFDVHDCEGLGEDYIGYDEKYKRATQFGLGYLRMGKELKPGHVITVEPGCYFIPQLIANWKAENKFTEFINYDKAEEMIGFGGVRIEDDVFVTEEGCRVLGKPIPKTIEEVEEVCNA
ncbi:MAG: aminopeptidase P family protein [Ignavibacteria bacterium]|jgi:Xaa-Pro aminopeptidase